VRILQRRVFLNAKPKNSADFIIFPRNRYVLSGQDKIGWAPWRLEAVTLDWLAGFAAARSKDKQNRFLTEYMILAAIPTGPQLFPRNCP
jgi:hypothetical protein